jgi:tetratricopeptide (TPR) repeat protein
MKYLRFFAVGCVVIMQFLFLNATNYQEQFFKANEFYKAGKYQQAQELYETIPQKSPNIHYNLGNCAYKLGKIGYALVHWRRAEKNWGLLNRTELLHNITLVKKCNKRIDTPNDSPIEKVKENIVFCKSAIISFVRSASLLLLQLLFLLMWLISFLYLRYLYQRKKRAAIILLFTANIFCGILLAVRCNFEYREHGIIVAKQAELMSGPGKNYQSICTISETTQVLIKGSSHGFYKVKTNGIIGWVAQSNIETY